MKEKQKLNYHVIASGSSGNAVRIGGIMVDCGVGFTEMKEDLYQVDTLLITHAHSDHVKPSTLESIRREFPRIKVYGNADVAYRYDVDKLDGSGEAIGLFSLYGPPLAWAAWSLTPFNCAAHINFDPAKTLAATLYNDVQHTNLLAALWDTTFCRAFLC